MEQQSEKSMFDFTKKIEDIIDDSSPRSNKLLRNAKFASFLAITGLSIGLGLGLANGFVEVYKIKKTGEVKIAEMHAKSEQLLKSKKVEIDAQIYARESEQKFKAAQAQKIQDEKIALENDKYAYDLLINNKDNIISNYESQLKIYDNAYQRIVEGVDVGVLGLDDLAEVRGYYQQYRNDINNWINFIERTTTSFEKFRSLKKEDREFLTTARINYQNGNLNRNTDLEDIMIEKISNTDNDSNEKIKDLRKELRDQIIDDLAAILKNDTPLTTAKKLKK